MRWVVGVSVAVVLASAYLTWTAARVDRLHVRVAAAARALDAHLLRRAAAAAVLAEEQYGVELYAAARIALDAASPEEREAAENDLTRQLRATALVGDDPATEAVVVASRRLVLARQLHTDLVRDALLARRRPLVRLLRFGRRHDEPRYFDIDDPTLTRDPDLSSSPPVSGGGDTAVR
ncbi:hypothetical protein O7623_07190 [Solwaraspora sp. WMMD791]|uniref:hypothetical protein n=1 Tax=Solwaraspora sp. WMMD791 TaxID=3016086 RepID=UPI00249C5644|nr:hypothetical protein [Solwaraspora sp. WMMD791]WFE28962.1 hypothetical protein O7623_07190 [Solwaraspora sp. WMMD791]